MPILITGGAGYIGSHTSVELLEAGHEIVLIDNMSNSSKQSVERIKEITKKDLNFHVVDILDKVGLEKIFQDYKIEAVIHFAGLKAVGESVAKPFLYYKNNVVGTLNLLEVMANSNVKNLIFSSSATVYGDSADIPYTEKVTGIPTNPYGATKGMIERILQDTYIADPQWNISLLRYFNPVGAHPSGDLGEDPRGIPNNLMPYIAQVAGGKLEKLSVFGDDYDTKDGSPIRDYIHVIDLAQGHIQALAKLKDNPGLEIYNLGTGEGYSVFEMISAFEEVSGVKIDFEVVGRRAGDVPISLADPSKANEMLNWRTEKNLGDMCMDAWRWQHKHPNGFDD